MKSIHNSQGTNRPCDFGILLRNPSTVTENIETEVISWLQAHPEDMESMDIFIGYCYNKYGNLIATITKAHSNKVEIADTIQQTMLQIFRHLQDFRKDGTLSSWISVIAMHCVMQITRRARYTKEIRESDIIGTRKFEAVNAQKNGSSTGTKILESDIVCNLFTKECLEKLAKGYRTVFTLRHVYGLEHNEIAKELQIAEGTSKTQLMKARGRLQKIFNG